jgi:flagellar biosynthesis regulator FlaF
MEFTLGIEVNDKDESSNAKDKSKAIVTIEGITQSFKLWQRKIKDDIDNWDKERLTRALSLLEPIEAQARAIRERINADKA